MRTVAEVLALSSEHLKARAIPTARLDTELLLGHVLGLTRLQVYLHFDRPLAPSELETIRDLVRRRGRREPLAWILGRKEFYGRDFKVVPGVLVPRPDTETLVELLLERIPADATLFLADIGAGTGCIGLSLAVVRPGLRVFAVDLSVEALNCVKENAEALGVKERVALLRGDLLDPIPADRPLDWIVSNPPYIATPVLAGLEAEVSRHEPRLALDGGPDGLATIRRLIPQAARRASIGVALEIGHDQGPSVRILMEEAGLVDVEVRRDLAGNDRVVVGNRPTSS